MQRAGGERPYRRCLGGCGVFLIRSVVSFVAMSFVSVAVRGGRTGGVLEGWAKGASGPGPEAVAGASSGGRRAARACRSSV